MKKSVFLMMSLCFAIWGLKAQNTYTTVNRFEGEMISEIEASGAWKIQLSQGNATQVKLTFPDRFKEQLLLTLQNGELKIGFRGNIKPKSGEKFEAVIVCSSLHEIDLSGACQLNGNGSFSGGDVKFDLSGAAKVNMEGPITASRQMEADLTGAAKLMVKQLSAQQMEVELSGASQLELTGKAVSGELEASGAAKFDLSGFEVNRVQVDLSGAANGKLNVTEQITGEISGAAKLFYAGKATTRIDVSGAGSLKHQ